MNIFKTMIFVTLCGILCPQLALGDDLQYYELYGEQRQESKQVTINPDGATALVTFWRSDCALCLQELQFLRQVATRYPKLPITVVSLEDSSHTHDYFATNFPETIHVLVAIEDTQTVLGSFGHQDSTLPFNMALYGNGNVCERLTGPLTMSVVDSWIARCQ